MLPLKLDGREVLPADLEDDGVNERLGAEVIERGDVVAELKLRLPTERVVPEGMVPTVWRVELSLPPRTPVNWPLLLLPPRLYMSLLPLLLLPLFPPR